MNIDDLTIGQLKEIKSLIVNDEKHTSSHFFQIGKNYFIQTVTTYYLGVLKAVSDKEILLGEVSWIPDTGRFNEFIQHNNLSNSAVEIEPILQDMIIGRGAVIAATLWNSSLPKEVK